VSGARRREGATVSAAAPPRVSATVSAAAAVSHAVARPWNAGLGYGLLPALALAAVGVLLL
jgi:hypothetical protein